MTSTVASKTSGKLAVILGGVGKGQDFKPLALPLGKFARVVVLIGEDAPIIDAALKATLAEHHVPMVYAKTFEESLRVSRDACQSGDAVLLSPACASFDMFLNYEDRGTQFEQMVLSK